MSTTYDIFMSHNGLDKPLVERLCWALLDAGLRPWFDKWDLAPGDSWIREIERVLDSVPAVLVCVGAHGLSAWHEAERQAALERATSKGTGMVVPVLLPGAPERVELPVFLRGLQAVDLRVEQAWQVEVMRLAATLLGKTRSPHIWIDERHERPYRGLQPFTEADAGWMFGREREEARLLDALREGQRFITVVGASGSGKSSLVRAGVVPAVRTGGVDGIQRWHALVLRPGPRPCHSLALKVLALRRSVAGTGVEPGREGDELGYLRDHLLGSAHALSDAADLLLVGEARDEQLLLVVDQFEELFTEAGIHESASQECSDGGVTRLAPEGSAFLRNLLHATSVPGGRVRVILTVRADFTGECLAIAELARRMERMNFALAPMEAGQLRETIRRPALRVGHDVEAALVDVLVSATEGQIGRLPLLQHTLDVLWDARDRRVRQLTHAAYHEHIGSLEASVAKRAEEVFAALLARSADNGAAARRVFLRLVHLGEGTGDTRRQMPRSELAGDVAAKAVLEAFTQARLLVTDVYRGGTEAEVEQAAEIAHEALLGRWGRLRQWLNESRDSLRTRQAVNLTAREWQQRGRPADELWRGARLAHAFEMIGERNVDLSADEHEFLRESRAAEQAVRNHEQRLQRRRLLQSVTASIVLCLLLILAVSQYVIANGEIRKAEEEREGAKAAKRREQSARAGLLARIPGRALEALDLGVRAFGPPGGEESEARTETIQGMGEALARARRTVVLSEHPKSMYSKTAVWTTDGLRAATASEDGTTTLWNGDTGAPLANLDGSPGPVTQLAWANDGTRLAIARRGQAISLWDGVTGAPLATFDVEGEGVTQVVWAADGKRLATASRNGTVELWDGRSGSAIATLEGHTKEIVSIAWAADGAHLATGSDDATARLWDVHTGKAVATLAGHRKSVWELAWTTDGARLVTSSIDSTRLWDGKTGALVAPLTGHTGAVLKLAWTTDGTRLATSGEDWTTRLWDGKTGAHIATLEGHTKPIRASAWTANGRRLATGSEDGTARLWDAKTGRVIATLDGHAGDVNRLQWTADESHLITVSDGGTVKLWNGSTSMAVASFDGDYGRLLAVALAADGKRMVIVDKFGTVTQLELQTGAATAVLEGHTRAVEALAWSTNETRLATASEDGTARLWDGETGAPVAVLAGHTEPIRDLKWTVDGAHLATASLDGMVKVWDGRTGEDVASLAGHTRPISAMAWTVDGTRLATASHDKTARLWDSKTGRAIAVLGDHDAPIAALAWAVDGTRLATAGEDGTARLWDGKTGAAMATLPHTALASLPYTSALTTLAWTDDGTRLATGDWGGTTKLWDGSVLAQRECN